MNLAIRIAAAILSVPPDVLAPMVPMMASPPRNSLERQLRREIDSALAGACCSAVSDAAPLFVLSESETSFVDCRSGLPSSDGALFRTDEHGGGAPSTYGEITLLGARQLFHHLGLYNHNDDDDDLDRNNKYQFFDLGSGGGRLVLQSHLELPSVCRSVGIELSPTRHRIAMQTLNELVVSGTVDRIQQLARQSRGWDDDSASVVDLREGDLFELDISEATHMYLSSLCFAESMLERIVDKIETEGLSLQIVATLRLLPARKGGGGSKVARLGDNPWKEFIQMTWNRGDGCPVYFYSVKHEL